MQNIVFTDELVIRQITDLISENLTVSDLESTVLDLGGRITSCSQKNLIIKKVFMNIKNSIFRQNYTTYNY